METNSSPHIEAKALLKLARQGNQSAERIRAAIIGDTPNPHRMEVLLRFDAGLIKRGKPAVISRELRGAVLYLIRRNWTWRNISCRLGLSTPTLYKHILKHLNASTFKTGRGRRFTPEQIAEIKAAIQTNKTQAVAQQFRIDPDTVRKFRREMGDYSNHRHHRALTPQQAEEIRTSLVPYKVTWRAIANKYGVGISTIGHVFRKEYGY